MRVLDCPHSTEQSAFWENAYLEMACLSCRARWSRRTGPDDIQVMRGLKRHSHSRCSLAKIWVDDATAADDQQDRDVFRMQPFLTVQKGGARNTCYGACFTVCALVFYGAPLGGAGDVGGLRFRRLGRELHHVDRSSRITTRTGIPAGTATSSFVFWHHGSASSQGDRTDVSRYTAEDHGDQCNQDVAGHDAEERPLVEPKSGCQ